ncbi:hypothetical protein ACHHYP_06808, partial [Achlya hypogyna]
DPLSPLLFVLALEPLCNSLRNNAHLGIRIGTITHVTSCFADDLQLFALNEDAHKAQIALVTDICVLSGFKLNIDKTQLLTYAPLPPPLAPLVVRTSAPAKSFGILVAPRLPPSARADYALGRFQDRLRLWLYKTTTLAGKAAILRFVCLPVLRYQLAWVAPTTKIAAAIDRMCVQFVHGEAPTISSTRHGHNKYLPVDHNFVSTVTSWYTRYERTMALIEFTNVTHVHEAMQSPGGLPQSVANRFAVHGNLFCRPTPKWLKLLANTVETFGTYEPLDPKPMAPRLVNLNGSVGELHKASPAQARHRPKPPHTTPPLKTRHLKVADDFYSTRTNVDSAAALQLPDGVLPKYADLVYKIVLRALPVRAHMPFLTRGDKECSFCPHKETYAHLFVDSDFTRDVWSGYSEVFDTLGVTLPEVLGDLLFKTPRRPCGRFNPALTSFGPSCALVSGTGCGAPVTIAPFDPTSSTQTP